MNARDLHVGNQEFADLANTCDVLKLQCSDLGRKADNETCHLPRTQTLSRCLDSSALDVSIVLLQASYGIRRATDIQTLMSNGRAKKVTAVECRDWSIHDFQKMSRAFI